MRKAQYVEEVQRRHEITQNLPLNVACRFLDHGLVRIVRDLTVKKYLGADFTLPMIYLLLF